MAGVLTIIFLAAVTVFINLGSAKVDMEFLMDC